MSVEEVDDGATVPQAGCDKAGDYGPTVPGVCPGMPLRCVAVRSAGPLLMAANPVDNCVRNRARTRVGAAAQGLRNVLHEHWA